MNYDLNSVRMMGLIEYQHCLHEKHRKTHEVSATFCVLEYEEGYVRKFYPCKRHTLNNLVSIYGNDDSHLYFYTLEEAIQCISELLFYEL